MNNKKEYEKPIIDVIILEKEDIIRTSANVKDLGDYTDKIKF